MSAWNVSENRWVPAAADPGTCWSSFCVSEAVGPVVPVKQVTMCSCESWWRSVEQTHKFTGCMVIQSAILYMTHVRSQCSSQMGQILVKYLCVRTQRVNSTVTFMTSFLEHNSHCALVYLERKMKPVIYLVLSSYIYIYLIRFVPWQGEFTTFHLIVHQGWREISYSELRHKTIQNRAEKGFPFPPKSTANSYW